MSEETSPRWYYEAAIAEKIGLPHEELKYLRTDLLEKEKEWRLEGRHVAIVDAGLKKLLDFMGAGSGSPAFDQADFSSCLVLAGKKEGPALTELVVFKIFPNPRLLLAKLATPADPDGPNPPVRVQVQRNDNFRPGMRLKARLIREGMYQLEGRCPRYPGRY